MTLCRRAVAVMVNMAVILAIAVGAPVLLLRFLGNPLRFVADHLRELDDPHMSPTRLTLVLIAFGWLLWLLLVASLVMETVACMRGVHAPRLPGLRPVQALAAAIVAGHTATLLAPAIAAAAPTTAGDSYHTASTTTAATMSVSGQTTGHVDSPAIALAGNTTYSYIVKRSDNLSKIANAWLGDPARWPEICALNKHRHFPAVGGTLRNCNLIYPGWDLQLPADARPPTHATPTPPIPNPPPAPVSPVPSISPPSADSSNGKSDDKSDDGVTAVVPTPGVGTGSQSTVSPPTGATSPTHPAASATVGGTITVPATRDPTPDGTTRTPVPDGHGVRLPDGSWVTWTLAAAITAATALVWLQRRRRFIPETDDDPITELPAPVNQLRRALAQEPKPAPDLDRTDPEPESTATGPEPGTLPAGGIGLLGEGAEAAARAALVAALASGDPEHPHGRGQVVIDTTTFTTLTGADAALLTQWPRLHLAADLDHALAVIEEQLLHRSRILDQHSLSDLDSLRQQAPDEEALPPILLICHTPPGNAQMRTKACMALGAEVQVSVVVLGEWAHGATIEVAGDGRTRLVAGQPTQPMPPRIPVLQTAATAQILATFQEAHTGRPPAPTTAQMAASASVAVASQRAVNASDPAVGDPAAGDPAAGDPAAVPDTVAPAGSTAKEARARLCVLGTPRIDNITAPGRPLRAKALELAVFLACHPDGASTRDIGEYLEPDARLSQADQRVHTNASNLRHNLARTAPAANNGHVVKFAGRYRLDPATVDVDVWRLRDLLRRGSIAAGERRRALLTEACDLYTAPLADGQDYEWITPHREAVRRCATEAHLLLADDLLDTDPTAASHLLDKAIGLERYNEALYRKAMQARHALGDTDGIRTLLRALTRSLSDLDAEPDEETLTLAATLRSNPPAPATTNNVPRSHAVTDAVPMTATGPDIGAGQAGITDRSQAPQNGAIR